MLKKPLWILGLLGLIIIIGGLLFNPLLIAKVAHHGKTLSLWMSIWIYLIELVLFVLGGALILESVVFSLLPEGKRNAQYFFGIVSIGILITVVGIISSPSFFQKKLLHIYQLNIFINQSLYNLQLVILIIGGIFFLIAFLFFILKFLKAKKAWSFISIPIIIIIYFLLIYGNYFNKRYPNNIFFTKGTLGKVYELLVGRDILLSDFTPRTTLKLHNKEILRAKYPVIDMHFHFLSDFITESDRKILQPDSLIKAMDSLNIKIIIGNDGQNIEELLKKYHDRYPNRFLDFTTLMTGNWPYTDKFMASRPAKLEELVKDGLSGIGEFPKELGLKIRDTSGKLINVDDSRLDPIWEKAGELGIPILWHVADPIAFFQPVNRFNERFIELSKYPEWSYAGPNFPSRDSLFKHRENVIKKHPNTIFIGAHLGWNTYDLDYCGYLLDKYPNYYVEFGTVLSELGRQPYTARKFFIKHQDKIVFGTDGGGLFDHGWTIEKYYRTYFEFLETENEYFDYPLKGAINQGNWEIYGINLPDTVLQKIYYKNAEKILSKNKNFKEIVNK